MLKTHRIELENVGIQMKQSARFFYTVCFRYFIYHYSRPEA